MKFVIVLLLAIIILIIARIFYLTKLLKIIHKKGSKSPEDYGLKYKNLEIHMKDDCILRGWNVNSDSDNTVIIFHNLNGNKEKYLKRIKYLHDINWNVVILDLRSHGESDYTGNNIYHDVVEDGRTIINYIFNNIANKKGKIVLYGFSMGSFVAASCMFMDMVDGVILDSGPAINVSKALYSMAGRITKNRVDKLLTFSSMKYFYGIKKCDFKKMINNFKNTNKHILFIHGDKDEFISCEDTKEMYRICPSKNKFYLLVKGSHHLTNEIYGVKQYKEELDKFFDNV